MATVHLVCGFLGAGKTTFSKALAERVHGVRFSVDEISEEGYWGLKERFEAPSAEPHEVVITG